jgi:hypothetical protein
VFELFLLEGLLPLQGHHPISDQLDRIFPGKQYEPHPNIGREIETVLRQHPIYRIAVYLITFLLASGNALLISKVLKARRRLARS